MGSGYEVKPLVSNQILRINFGSKLLTHPVEESSSFLVERVIAIIDTCLVVSILKKI